MTDYYKDGHPLDGKFRSEKDWTTDISAINFNLPEKTRCSLIKTIAKKAYQSFDEYKPDGKDSKYTSRHHYNMFVNDEPHIVEYKEIANELIRYYVANSWGAEDVENMEIKAKCFGNIQSYGQRTYPHYHHGFEGVLITYLTVGNEFSVDRKCMEENNWDDFLIPVPEDEYYSTMEHQTPMSPSTHPKDFEKQGNMLLLDPISRSYPYNRKARAISPENGLSVLHPGYLWHESNTFTGGGIRVAIIVNFNIGISKSADPLVIL